MKLTKAQKKERRHAMFMGFMVGGFPGASGAAFAYKFQLKKKKKKK